MSGAQELWQGLFVSDPVRGSVIEVPSRSLQKRGRPLLLLPQPAWAAAATFDLYPAQTAKARAVRTALGQLAQLGFSAGTERVALKVSQADPFIKFLADSVGLSAGTTPVFGILAGNPVSPGQRFIFLVFDGNKVPRAVVKLGVTAEARDLIRKETTFLEKSPANLAGIPGLQGKFEDQNRSAFATEFFPGKSPGIGETESLDRLLQPWINRARQVPLKDLSIWQVLERTAPKESLAACGALNIANHRVHPCLQHGDLAPWNIKVSPNGSWTVIDWERGNMEGIPGWDWFHFHLQTAILVGRLPLPQLAQRAEAMLRADEFKKYASTAGIEGIARPLLAAYLLHVVHVLRPAEGRSETEALWRELARRSSGGPQ